MRNYLIIGGSSGIGRALSRLLAEEGNRTYATYRSSSVEESQNLSFHPLDVLSESFDFSYLPEKLDGLAYCPGSIDLKPFQRVKPSDLIRDYELQVLGFFRIMQELLPRLKAGNASVVTFSTIAVQTGFPFHAQVAASKGAIEGLTRSLAAELAPVIRVNSIAPSITDTPLAARLLSTEDKKEANAQRHPLKKVGEAKDLAEMAAFLLSPKSAWITGQIMHVDGGLSSIKN